MTKLKKSKKNARIRKDPRQVYKGEIEEKLSGALGYLTL